ncbi:Cytochrome b561 [BD1-7 clade bacterium]|uniref:Cytochrome b561 n=1 Tax=BD1-7 clade bacterium TaxID=2029982 RepID=A0A5S9PSM9_9GAMM|nr:Cytochrome b561 [BD1-7 clade bacterium]
MLTNSDKSYGWVTILLHWSMALCIFFMFGLGVYMVDLSYYDTWYHGSLDLHKSIGSLLIGVWMVFFAWHLINKKPAPEPGKAWEQLTAKLMHKVLYLTIGALLLSGYLISSADGAPIDVFGIVKLPAWQLGIENQETVFGDIHEILAWLLIGLVALHASAALKHHFFDKDKTLKRMIKPIK